MSSAGSTGLPDWQRAGDEPRPRALIRVEPEDFRVTEILNIDFDGQGEHDWLWIEKRLTNTEWLARQLSRFAGVVAKDVGFAGQKDRHAVTRQWFSVRRTSGAGYDWSTLDLPGVTILEIARHSRKLRRGAHRGNRFDLVLRDVAGDAEAGLQRIRNEGLPNYFGEQRFGHRGGNIEMARSLFGGRRLRRDKRSLAVSAARSLLFNDILAARVSDKTWNTLLPGDHAVLDGTHSHFEVLELDETLAQRCRDFDLHPSAPLWGKGAATVTAPAAERRVAALHADLAAGLEKLAVVARRALRVRAASLQWERQSDVLRLGFELPSGAFATAVLREVFDYEDSAVRISSVVA
ncbi:MAG: tRNA pseudouridine(13) synthase TruD [Woeseia sp.]